MFVFVIITLNTQYGAQTLTQDQLVLSPEMTKAWKAPQRLSTSPYSALLTMKQVRMNLGKQLLHKVLSQSLVHNLVPLHSMKDTRCSLATWDWQKLPAPFLTCSSPCLTCSPLGVCTPSHLPLAAVTPIRGSQSLMLLTGTIYIA